MDASSVVVADQAMASPVTDEFLPGIENHRVTMIFGLPRSGTTWFAKMLDSHPDVLYRHEPDSIIRPRQFPEWPGAPGDPDIIAQALGYLRSIMMNRTLKSVGSRPLFHKNYHCKGAGMARAAMVYGCLFAEKAMRVRPARMPGIPDFIRKSAWPKIRLVMKSISSVNRMGLFIRSVPGSRNFLLLRHPLGQVASMLRGVKLDKFEGGLDLRWLLHSPMAKEFHLTAGVFANMDLAERLAWQWVLLTAQAHCDLASLNNVTLVRHDDLVLSPQWEFMKVFERAGLSWNRQTHEFLEASTNPSFITSYHHYFGITRDPGDEIDKWRRELTPEEQKKIWHIARFSPMAAFWPEGIS